MCYLYCDGISIYVNIEINDYSIIPSIYIYFERTRKYPQYPYGMYLSCKEVPTFAGKWSSVVNDEDIQ